MRRGSWRMNSRLRAFGHKTCLRRSHTPDASAVAPNILTCQVFLPARIPAKWDRTDVEMEAQSMSDEPLDLPPMPEPPRRVTIQRGDTVPNAVTLRLPGAKYYTLRYLLAAFLAEGESRVSNPALSDDTVVLVRAIRALGGRVAWEHD